MLRSNLTLIKLLVEKWKGVITVQKKAILALLRSEDKAEIHSGLQLFGVLLAAGLPAYSPQHDFLVCEELTLYEEVVRTFAHRTKMVMQLGAEVVGMIVAQQSDGGTVSNELVGLVQRTVNDYLLDPKEYDRGIACLNRIAFYFAPIVDSFVSRVLFLLSEFKSEFKAMALQVLRWRADHIPDLSLSLEPVFGQLFVQRNTAVQAAALALFRAMVESAHHAPPPAFVERFLALVADTFVGHPDAACRSESFDLMAWVYDNGAPELAEHEAVRRHLLAGLSDPSAAIKEKLLAFWDHEQRLPRETIDRLAALLDRVYHPGVESSFLATAATLLLRLCAQTPDFTHVLHTPLEEVEFTPVAIDTKWVPQTATSAVGATPLFGNSQDDTAMSLASGPGGGTYDGSGGGGGGPGGLRATQGAIFDATEAGSIFGADGESGEAFNTFYGGASLGTMTLNAGGAGATSRLLFHQDKFQTVEARRARAAAARNAAAATAAANSRNGDVVEMDIGSSLTGTFANSLGDSLGDGPTQVNRKRFKLRFTTRTQGQTRAFHARRMHRIAKMQATFEAEKKRMAANRVVVFRQYRRGELPDVAITPADVLKPLGALVEADVQLARLFFVLMFEALFTRVQDLYDEEAADGYAETFRVHVQRILNTTNHYGPLVGCMQDVCLRVPALRAANNLTGESAVRSRNYHNGIRLVEDSILNPPDHFLSARPRKRQRTAGALDSGNLPEKQGWVALAHLFSATGDFDVLRGVYDVHISQTLVMHAGMEAQLDANYHGAWLAFTEALQTVRAEGGATYMGVPVDDAELDLWDLERLRCMEAQCKWGELAEQLTPEPDDGDGDPESALQELWTDDPAVVSMFVTATLKSPAHHDTLLAFVNGVSEDRRPTLESRFLLELALFAVANGDLDRARHYIDRFHDDFLLNWGHIHPLASAARRTRLQALQIAYECEEFLDFVASGSNFVSDAPLAGLLQAWSDRMPSDVVDGVGVWDSVVFARSLYMDELSARLDRVRGSGGATGQHRLEEARSEFLLRAADAVGRQGHLGVASMYVMRTQGMAGGLDSSFHGTSSMVRIGLRASASKAPDLALVEYEKLVARLANVAPMIGPDDQIEYAMLLGTLFKRIAALARAPDADDVLNASGAADLADHLEVRGGFGGADDLGAACTAAGYEKLEAAVRMAEDQAQGVPSMRALLAETCFSFAAFCDEILRGSDDGGDEAYARGMIEATLKAMKAGSTAAQDRFPRLLEVSEASPGLQALVADLTADVPAWMFVRWTAQLLAVMDLPHGDGVVGVVERIARAYPQAMYYPFRISSEDWGPDGRDRTAAVAAALAPLRQLDAFIEALGMMTNPGSHFVLFVCACACVFACVFACACLCACLRVSVCVCVCVSVV